MFDPTSFAFTSFVNQHSGYYTPTPGGMTTAAYHNQAGDLHTPGMAFHLGTPLSMPTSEGQTLPASVAGMHGFHPHLLESQPFPTPHLFGTQPSYAPSALLHPDSGFDPMEPAPGSPAADTEVDLGLRTDSTRNRLTAGAVEPSMPAPGQSGAAK